MVMTAIEVIRGCERTERCILLRCVALYSIIMLSTNLYNGLINAMQNFSMPYVATRLAHHIHLCMRPLQTLLLQANGLVLQYNALIYNF